MFSDAYVRRIRNGKNEYLDSYVIRTIVILRQSIFICKVYLYIWSDKVPLDDILFSSNGEIIPVDEMGSSGQKVMIFDDYVCEKNQNDILFKVGKRIAA